MPIGQTLLKSLETFNSFGSKRWGNMIRIENTSYADHAFVSGLIACILADLEDEVDKEKTIKKSGYKRTKINSNR